MRIFDPQFASGKTNKNITKLCRISSASFMFIADGRLFIAKGEDGQRKSAYHAAISNDGPTSMLAGLSQTYEIVFPDEVGGLIDADGTSGEAAYALFDNGNLYTWGHNSRGNLGLGHTNMMPWPTLSATDVVEVYIDPSNLGGDKDYGRLMHKKRDGWVYGTGYNGGGELGLGNTNQYNAWTRLDWMGQNPKSVWNLGSYRGQTVVQHEDGRILGCGYNSDGALGIGTINTLQTNPFDITQWIDGDTTFEIKKVMYQSRWYSDSGASNQNSSMMIWSQNPDGVSKVRGAGYSAYGTLANGATADQPSPQPVIGLEEEIVTDFIVKGNAVGTAYALNSRNELWGWGYNDLGQLGDRTTTGRGEAKLLLTDVLEITAKDTSANIWAWKQASPTVRRSDGYYVTGRNFHLSLGTGNNTENQTTTFWTKVKFPENIRIKHMGQSISGYNRVTKIAIDEDNNVYAWGCNDDGLLDTRAAQHVPIPIRWAIPALRM